MRCITHRLVLLAVVFLPLVAAAQPAVPLVVVRFNQPNVYFDQQLYSALSRAVAVKADLLFDVVAYSPQTGNPQMDSGWQARASQDAQQVVVSMQQMGVPLSRITLTGQPQQGLRFDETHIYVH